MRKIYMYYIKLRRLSEVDSLSSEMGVSKDTLYRFLDSYTPPNQYLPVYYKMDDGLATVNLYAYTDKKKYAKQFEIDHDMRWFIKRTKEISSHEYSQFESDAGYARMLMHQIDTEHKLLLPQHEIEQIDDFHGRMRIELSELATYPYQIFTDEYIKALDMILYCTYYQCSCGNDPDYYEYNYSGFGITAENYCTRVDDHIDYFSVYCYMYSLVLRKDNAG